MVADYPILYYILFWKTFKGVFKKIFLFFGGKCENEKNKAGTFEWQWSWIVRDMLINQNLAKIF